MSDEITPVRIELDQAMTFGFVVDDDGQRRGSAKVVHAALIHPITNGRASRKPAARIVADSRADVLRLLADWIDANDDDSFAALIAQADSLGV